ncbi:MAG: hypothetical protein AB1656_13005 [Candidatus Omnitrophota bacterium]
MFCVQVTIYLILDSVSFQCGTNMAAKAKKDSTHYEYFLWDGPESALPQERLRSAVEEACRNRQFKRGPEKTDISFYPYSGLKSTIKVDGGIARIRISDILRDAPSCVLEALIHILMSRVEHRKPQEEYLHLYNRYISRDEVEAEHARARLSRSRKILPGPEGKHFNLNRVFDRINRLYFEKKLEKPVLSWSPGRSRQQLGYHDAHLNLIVISRWLDRKSVPPYLVDYIMYHELLHIVLPPMRRSMKRIVHSQEFKKREGEFQYYEDAIRWLHHCGLK